MFNSATTTVAATTGQCFRVYTIAYNHQKTEYSVPALEILK